MNEEYPTAPSGPSAPLHPVAVSNDPNPFRNETKFGGFPRVEAPAMGAAPVVDEVEDHARLFSEHEESRRRAMLGLPQKRAPSALKRWCDRWLTTALALATTFLFGFVLGSPSALGVVVLIVNVIVLCINIIARSPIEAEAPKTKEADPDQRVVLRPVESSAKQSGGGGMPPPV